MSKCKSNFRLVSPSVASGSEAMAEFCRKTSTDVKLGIFRQIGFQWPPRSVNHLVHCIPASLGFGAGFWQSAIFNSAERIREFAKMREILPSTLRTQRSIMDSF